MNNFKKPRFGNGFKNKENRDNRGSGKDLRPVTMHKAVCASCGKTCDIPFKPTGDKPVYCRDCFAGRMAMGGDRSKRRDPRKNGYANRDSGFGNRENFSRDNFSKDNFSNSKNSNDDLKRQINLLNDKVDKLAYSLSKLINSKKNGFNEEEI